MRHAMLVCIGMAGVAAAAQLPGGLDRIQDVAGKFQELRVTDDDEIRLGRDVSARIRDRYGVVQDPPLHRYVSLVGRVVAARSSRPTLAYEFIVLDTDGVNAFAAPGGFVHVTRGALSLMRSEAELAGVLAHEIAHVSGRHTIRAVRREKIARLAADERGLSANPELFRRVADQCFHLVFAGFGRADELEADERGLGFVAAAGYHPSGLRLFLAALTQRNARSDVRQGLFSSHPDLHDRMERLDTMGRRNRHDGAVLRERFSAHIRYRPVDLTGLVVEHGAAGVVAGEKKKSRFSLSRLKNPLGAGEQTRQSAAVTGSGGSRALDRERAAKGGSHPSAVRVPLTGKDIERFKREGRLPAG